MKPSTIRPCVILLALALLPACSGPPENSASSNNNAATQANSNSNQQPQAQDQAPSPTTETPLKVQPIPPPSPPANTNANIAAKTASGRLPKLVAPEKKLDFGKQPQDKTIVRAIHIKNAGQAALNIESVTPS
ncbi:MAG TPA: hypothetical protein VKF81_07845 [Blastocatellia bacterium]|nr:hypothetical protein [Blastocatellia bacterium]